jgi:hypothetical protein
MKLKHLFQVFLCLVVLSCSEADEPEIACDNYFLNQIDETNAHYNTDGLISEYIFETDTIAKFGYNSNKLLAYRKTGEFHVYYHYDGANKLKYLLEYDDGIFRDSISFEYNPAGLISTMKYYTYLNFTLTVTKKREFEYTGKNSTTVRSYTLDNDNLPNLKLRVTTLYEFDNKKLAFPPETWPFFYVFDNGVISENNVTKQITTVVGQPEGETIYSYKYNNAGYPTQLKIGNRVAQEYSYTCEPRLRGTN